MDWRKTHYTDLPKELQNEVKTERQWAKLGYVPKRQELGERMYSNWFHNAMFTYFHANDMRPASMEELNSYFAEERKRRSEKQKVRNRKRKEEEKKYWDELIQNRDKLYSQISYIEKNYQMLCRMAAMNTIEKNFTAEAETIVLDIETTGLSPSTDEILQVSIINAANGETLFNEYFKPFMANEWHEAEQINHITKEMVEEKPFFLEAVGKISAIIRRAKTIIGYNVFFDVNYLEAYGVQFGLKKYIDVMDIFSAVYGEYSSYYGNYKWQKLEKCAEILGYAWDGSRAHDSLADCRATLFCYKKLQEAEFTSLYENRLQELEKMSDEN